VFESPHYVPILKLKLGELQALQELQARLVDSPVTPFFDITPPAEDAEPEGDISAGEAHVAGTVARIMKHWSRTDPVYVDARALDRYPPGRPRAPADIAEEASGTDFQFVPVTGLRRSEEHNRAVRWAAEDQQLGVCIRIPPPVQDDDDFERGLQQLLDYLERGPEEIDILLDYGAIQSGHQGIYGREVLNAIVELPYVESWRSVITAGTSFPADINDKVADFTNETFERAGWKMYRHVYTNRDGIARVPAFSDYGITLPSMDKYRVQPTVMRITPTVKYTTDEEYVILRAEYREDDNFQQYRDLARRLVDLDVFDPDQTKADKIIQQYAAGAGSSPGNPQTWVKVGTARHLEKVGQQIASLPVP